MPEESHICHCSVSVGNIPMHLSVMQKNLECALLLLSAGSNINEKVI